MLVGKCPQIGLQDLQLRRLCGLDTSTVIDRVRCQIHCKTGIIGRSVAFCLSMHEWANHFTYRRTYQYSCEKFTISTVSKTGAYKIAYLREYHSDNLI